MDTLTIIVSIVIISIAIIFMATMADNIEKEKRLFIKAYAFPDSLLEKVKYHYPHLSDGQLSMVMEGLRQYLLNREEKVFFLMPSRVIDVAWHEFILCTELYEKFCTCGAGRFLHHRPAELMSISDYEEGFNNIWYRSCLREDIAPEAPVRLPLLFALDAELDIRDGCRYSLDDCARRHIKWREERKKQEEQNCGCGGC
jgi:hypothetical protein